MTHSYRILAAALAAAILTILGSCSSESSSPVNDSGLINPLITVDPTVDNGNGSPQTTVGMPPLPEELG